MVLKKFLILEMPRIFDSSHITQRRGEKAIAGSFLSTTASNVMYGSKPLLGIKDSSVMYAVKTGHSTQYDRLYGCVGISPGCPCPDLTFNTSPETPNLVILPGNVGTIRIIFSSIILSWSAPSTGSGPFSYIITPYLNGSTLSPVTTTNTSYTFKNLQEMQPYTFTVCAVNSSGQGPVDVTKSTVAPPQILADILLGTAPNVDVDTSLTHIIDSGLKYVMQYAVDNKKGPTVASRLMYLWVTSVVQAWNYITPDVRITGVRDDWNWDTKSTVLTDCDRVLWICSVIDSITPILLLNTSFSTYTSPYVCSVTEVERVKSLGNWDAWVSLWNDWRILRTSDGSVDAMAQPTIDQSPNMNYTLNVNGANNINGFPAPQKWTALTIAAKQNYLTYGWGNVRSTCLTAEDESNIEGSVSPADNTVTDSNGLTARDREIDSMMTTVQNLTDNQKVEAEFWAGSDAGIISPPLMSMWLWKEYVRCIGVTCPTLMYSMLDLAIHMFEGSRLTWLLKAKYMEDRPIQEVRRRYTGQQIASWNGVMNGANWVPYQTASFVTPPFADFPSGHSNFTKGFALTMTKWFGPNITKNDVSYDNVQLMAPLFKTAQSGPYGTFVISPRTSIIQSSVPAQEVSLAFETWEQIATSAGISRIYGGIHTETANTASQTVAIQIDGYINSTWSIDFT